MQLSCIILDEGEVGLSVRLSSVGLEEAVGMSLAHDLTEIDVEGGFKGARFKRGHVVRPEDLEVLRRMGKSRLWVIELEEGELHEDEASKVLASALAGDGIRVEGPSEGKCSFFSERFGLLHYDPSSVDAVNAFGVWALALLPPLIPVRAGEPVGSVRPFGLSVTRDSLEATLSVASPLSVRAFKPLKVALVTTGAELLEGRKRDAFRPRLEEKISPLGGAFLGQSIAGDEVEAIVSSAVSFLERGADVIIFTGGMSVDADDLTPKAISSLADEVLFRGVPAIPGNMLMLAKRGGVYLVGAPACVVFERRTSFDLLLLRLFAGLTPGEEEVRRWGVGGFCSRCEICVFPRCSFAARP